jgi:sugar lactone lactonase YvrE
MKPLDRIGRDVASHPLEQPGASRPRDTEDTPMRRRLALALIVALSLVATVAASPAAATDRERISYPASIDLPNGWQPEGITAGRGSTVYVGSLATGAVRTIDVRTGRQRTLVTGPGKPAVGVEFDRRNDRLWVAGGASGEVRVYDASSGRHLRTYTFPRTGFLNDLVVTRKAVYVTDSGIQELKVIPLGRGGRLPPTSSARTLPLTGDIAYVKDAFNGNGIVARGRWLILVQTVTGVLYRVDSRTGVGRKIDLGGEVVTFGDGLELAGRTLYVVRNQLERISVIRLARNLRSGELKKEVMHDQLDVPSTVARQDGRLWVVNARFATTPTPATTYSITRLPAWR